MEIGPKDAGDKKYFSSQALMLESEAGKVRRGWLMRGNFLTKGRVVKSCYILSFTLFGGR